MERKSLVDVLSAVLRLEVDEMFSLIRVLQILFEV
jgi:hypothetical protein